MRKLEEERLRKLEEDKIKALADANNSSATNIKNNDSDINFDVKENNEFYKDGSFEYKDKETFKKSRASVRTKNSTNDRENLSSTKKDNIGGKFIFFIFIYH